MGYYTPQHADQREQPGVGVAGSGKYEMAEGMDRWALEGYEKALGKEHPDTLTSVSNLALVLQYQGEYEAAEEMNWRALEGHEKALGE
jgi:Tfp pilus assembly protein PilF